MSEIWSIKPITSLVVSSSAAGSRRALARQWRQTRLQARVDSQAITRGAGTVPESMAE
jgi:hypothetical protein